MTTDSCYAAKQGKGYTCVANDLMEAMFNAHLSARQWAVCMALIRKTFGYQKMQDDIGLSQLVAITGIAKSHVSTTIKELVARNIVRKQPGSYGHILGVNTDYAHWGKKTEAGKISNALATTNALISQAVQRAKTVTDDQVRPASESVTVADAVTQELPNREKGGCQSGKTGIPESVTTKENHTKESLQKKTPKEHFASPAMRERFARFYAAYPKKKSRALAEKAFCKIAPDEQLLASMLLGIERAMTSAQWANPQMIPYPASWLNAQGWDDDIQTAYSDTERAVILAFNDALGEQLGMVDAETFVESRAGAIRYFLTFGKKPDWVRIYFGFVKSNCLMPPRIGFDWLLVAENFAKVRAGQYQIGFAA